MISVDQLLVPIIIALVIGAISYVIASFRYQKKINSRTWRQTQAIILMAKAIDQQTKMSHPEYKSSIHSDIDFQLKDEHGKY